MSIRLTINLTPLSMLQLGRIMSEQGFASKSECIRYLIRTCNRNEDGISTQEMVPTLGIPSESIKEAEQGILKNAN